MRSRRLDSIWRRTVKQKLSYNTGDSIMCIDWGERRKTERDWKYWGKEMAPEVRC